MNATLPRDTDQNDRRLIKYACQHTQLCPPLRGLQVSIQHTEFTAIQNGEIKFTPD